MARKCSSTATTTNTTTVDTTISLQHEDQIFVELLSEDGLLVMARGLGVERLLVKFLKLYCDPHALVLIINTSQTHEEYFISELVKEGVEHLPRQVTNEIAAKERELLYLKGGVLFVTSRILVVDLLKRQCPAESVSGILIYNAHRVTTSSTEAFILRLYREKNKDGFIKGFSESPEYFTTGFSQLERVVKNLFVRKVYLWPRFQAVVSATLEKHKPVVMELRQQMTPSMVAIQLSVLEVMKACVTELKTVNPSLDTEDVTVENCLGKAFDNIVKLQLDPIWNQLSSKTKSLVYDLKMLRTLLYFLTQYDCVTFWSYLDSLRSGGGRAFTVQSPWIFMDAANALFVRARERVYGRVSEDKKKSQQQLVLEESPKWSLLSMVLEEVKKEAADNPALGGGGKVVIVANDERTCYQLKQFLCDGGRNLLLQQYQRLLGNKKATEALPKEMQKELQAYTKAGKKSKDSGRGASEPVSKRSREDDSEIDPTLFEDVDLPRLPAVEEPTDFSILSNPLVVLHPLTSTDDPYHLTKLLNNNKPHFIIMYNADLKFVRQVEVFKAARPGFPVRVYFLLYDSSVEEQIYLTSVRKEKESFHQLIREKAHMVVPQDYSAVFEKEARSVMAATSTRKGGGRVEDHGPQRVVVDMREFRSSLPSLLHRRGMEILPVTLEVGDYILSPDMCVERKSINDLIGSLNSGRLFNQATAMTRFYPKPILLIECEEGKPFALQSSSLIRSEISTQAISSKLVLLTLHFPKLRILWSPSPHSTSELFEQLKSSQAQPDPGVAASIGIEGEGSSETVVYNTAAQDFLMKLPGINSKNCRLLMSKVKDLRELVSLSQAQLEKILENSSTATLLWEFLHHHHNQSETSGNTSKQKQPRPSAGNRGRGRYRKR